MTEFDHKADDHEQEKPEGFNVFSPVVCELHNGRKVGIGQLVHNMLTAWDSFTDPNVDGQGRARAEQKFLKARERLNRLGDVCTECHEDEKVKLKRKKRAEAAVRKQQQGAAKAADIVAKAKEGKG